MNEIQVSIIIPCHNEQTRLRESVFKIIRYGERELRGQYEILLVENGSSDETFAIARELQRVFGPVRAHHLEGRSKADAVRFGMLMALGQYRYMCDCDLSTPIEELTRFIQRIQDGWDVVIGSREHIDSQVETSFRRWFIGRMFSSLARIYTGIDFLDTQCGFKLFTAQAAEDIFSRTECKSMAFDVEALYLAKILDYHAIDIPVTWINDSDSRVRILRDSLAMWQDISRIRKIHASEPPRIPISFQPQNKIPV